MLRSVDRIGPDAIEMFVDLSFGIILSRSEAQCITSPYAQELLALFRREQLLADGLDVVRFCRRPDEDNMIL